MARAVTPRTKALLPVHLYGHPADLDPCWSWRASARHRAGGGRLPGPRRALQGPAGGRALRPRRALASIPTKNLGAFGDGGAVLVNDPDGRGAPAPAAQRRPERPLPPRGRRASTAGWTRCRPRSCASACATSPAWTERRRALAALYLRELRGRAASACPREQPYARAVYHLFVVRHPRRDALAAALKERGIGTLIHYPIPLHLQPAFAGARAAPGDFPVAEKAAGEILSLPLYPEMTDAQARRGGRAPCGRWPGSLTREHRRRRGRPCSPGSSFPASPALALLAAAAPARTGTALAKDEALFLAVGRRAWPSSAWLGLVLAEAGRFSLVSGRAVVAVACAAILVLGRRRAGARRWRAPAAPRRTPGRPGRRRPVPRALRAARPSTCWADATPASTSRRWASSRARAASPTSIPRCSRSPPRTWSCSTAIPSGRTISWGRFMGFPLERPQTGRVVPEFFHLFPAFGAYLFQAMGVRGALATPRGLRRAGDAGRASSRCGASSAPRPPCWARCCWRVNVLQVVVRALPGLGADVAVPDPVRPAGVRAVGGAARAGLRRAGGRRCSASRCWCASTACCWRCRSWPGSRSARAQGALPIAARPIRCWSRSRCSRVHALAPRRVLVAQVPAGDRQPPVLEPAPVAWLLGTALVIVVILAGHRLGPRIRALLRRPSGAPLRAAVAAALVLLAALRLRAAAGAFGVGGRRRQRSRARAGGLPAALRALDFHRLAAHDAQSLVRLGLVRHPAGARPRPARAW